MVRVATLLGEWATRRGESEREKIRWMAAGYLHDALRDEDPERLRGHVPAPFDELPGKVLHGPAAADFLRKEGVDDEELLHAISYHTVGSKDFGEIGFALVAADFLEPGRKMREDWRAELRERAAGDLREVVKEILADRLGSLLERRRPLGLEAVDMWNLLSEGEPWASASEF